MLKRVRKILEVTARRCYNVSGTSWKLTSWHLLKEVVTTYQKDVGSYWRRCFHVSKKSWNLMEEDVTTYQEHRDICWKKLLQRIRKILEVSAKRCYNLFQPVSSISVTPSVNVVPYVVLNVLKISLCKKPCCSWCSRTGLWKKLCCKSRFGQDKHMAWKNQWPKVEQWCSFWVCSYLGR